MGEIGPQAPRPGAFTICWQCDEFLRFDRALNLHRLTADDKREIDQHPQTQRELEKLRIAIFAHRVTRQHYPLTVE